MGPVAEFDGYPPHVWGQTVPIFLGRSLHGTDLAHAADRLEQEAGLVTVGPLLFQRPSVTIPSGAVEHRMAGFLGLLAGLCRRWKLPLLDLPLGRVNRLLAGLDGGDEGRVAVIAALAGTLD